MFDYEKALANIDSTIQKGAFKDTWESLTEWKVPAWFREKRLGIFTHWGLYSVPAAFNEWYSRNMYVKTQPEYSYHIKTFGEQKNFGYKDFIPLFTAEKFNADEWVSLFKEAGAGYICPVAEHHDGFQMYDSEISEWNAVKKNPHRDIIGELKAAAEKQGLVFCTSSHRAEHWWFMGDGKLFDSDIKEPLKRGDFYWPAMPQPDFTDLYSKPYPTKEYLDDWLCRTAEIVDKYEPAFLYFDWWIQHEAFKPYLKKLIAYYYSKMAEKGKSAAVCYKHDALAFGAGIVDVERGGFSEAKPYAWQTDTAVARNSWCYTNSLDYKSSAEIIATLIDVVSKNGNLLLNVGPKADGSIADGDRKILQDLGAWLKVNGEAINGSKVWRVSKEGDTQDVEGQFQDQSAKKYNETDFRFTAGNGAIYAFAMNYTGNVCIKSLGLSKDQNKPSFHGIIKDVKILGFDEKVNYTIDDEGLHFTTTTVHSDFPVTIKIELA